MLFEQRFWPLIQDGTVTVTFRRWKRRQAAPGRRRRTAFGFIDVDSVDVVDPAGITQDDAVAAGYPDAATLISDLRGTPDLPTYRIAFRYADAPDPRALLAADDELDAADVAAIDARLARLDAASAAGPWTRTILRLIADRPAVRAADLAASVGRETLPFKTDVRKLKNLGLTLSLQVGYTLSPRGEAYLRAAERRA